jgi:ABC-2 type transport system permease protein
VKNRIRDSLKSRKFRYGGYATLISVAVLAALVVVNVLVDQVPAKLDLTKEKLYSLSDQSLKLLQGLKQDITITTLGKPGAVDPTVKEILSRYAAASRHIKLATVDPEVNPGWVKQFSTGSDLQAGSLVVDAGGGRDRVISQYDLYSYEYDQQTYQPQLTGVTVEQRVTAAIAFVTEGTNVTVYTLKGYGADTLVTYGMNTPVMNMNYAEKDLDLLTTDKVPADAGEVLLLNPRYDLPAEDAQKLRTYLAGGGRLLVLVDLQRLPAAAPNLEELLANYGLNLQRELVVEGDPSRYAANAPYYVVPNLEYHDILSPLRSNNVPVLLPAAMVIGGETLRKQTLKVEPLLTTSDKAYAKPFGETAQLATLEKERGDASGPFTLADAVTDPATQAGGKDTKLIVVGSAGFMQTAIAQQVPGNSEFFLNCISWLGEKKEDIAIRPKSLLTYRLNISALWSLLLSGAVVILIPLGILGAGLGVWLKRRHL